MTEPQRPPVAARSNRSRWWLAAAALLVAALALLAFRVGWHGPQGSHGSSRTARPAPTGSRAAGFAYCPEIRLRTLPTGFTRTDSRLQALRDNQMGQVVTYSNGRAWLKTFSGIDALDALEDVELTTAEVKAGGKAFRLHSTAVFPGLLLAELERAETGCEGVFVQGTQVARAEFLSVLSGLEVNPGRR